MAHYAGLDVSLEQTSVCVVDEAGAVVLERRVATEPDRDRSTLALRWLGNRRKLGKGQLPCHSDRQLCPNTEHLRWHPPASLQRTRVRA
jgi:hypothetical protein